MLLLPNITQVYGKKYSHKLLAINGHSQPFKIDYTILNTYLAISPEIFKNNIKLKPWDIYSSLRGLGSLTDA